MGERLERIRSVHPTDRQRPAGWLDEQVGSAAARLDAAVSALATLCQPASLRGTMHDYQLDGLRWLVALHRCSLSGILADEMGLGKTMQAIGVLAHLAAADGCGGPFLVLAPLSTLSGWTQQLEQFCPALHVVRYSGDAAARQRLRAAHLAAGSPALRHTLLLSSYEPLLADAPTLGVGWSYVVVDEAHRLKSRASALYRCLLDEMGLGGVPRLLLTGTPLQNSADELFSLLHFVAPQIYDDADGFVRRVDELRAASSAAASSAAASSASASSATSAPAPASDSAASAAALLWRPLLLRRLKRDHLRLPPKREATILVPLTPLQRTWYRAVLERNRTALGAANARGLVNVLASLRKCCNHPYLFDGAEPEPFVEGEHLVTASAKLRLLDRLLTSLRVRGDRVLLFSQSTRMLDVLQDYLHLRRWEYERLDGSARAEERWAAVSSFQGGGGGGGGGGGNAPFVFLLSTRAGGLGLNLTAANTVIFYDSDWNPQADAQATDRVHRLGQQRPVLVITLGCRGTVEELILRRSQHKLAVMRGLIADGGAGGGAGGGASPDQLSPSDPQPSLAREAITHGLADLLRPAAAGGDGGGGDGGGGGGGERPPSDAELERLLSAQDAVAPAAAADGGSRPISDSIYFYDGVDFGEQRREGEARRAADEAAYSAMLQPGGAVGGAGDAADGAAGATGAAAAAGKRRRGGVPRSAEDEADERRRMEEAAEEAARARKRKALQRKHERWAKAGYTSLALPDAAEQAARAAGSALAGGGSGSDTEDDDAEESGDESSPALRFKVGDAMATRGVGGAGLRIVLCWCDASGRWPTRGFFRSVSAVSDAPRAAYEAAREHGDLEMGSVHLVNCDRDRPGLWVALLVVLSRDRRAPPGTPPALCSSSLDTALPRLDAAARALGATMHSPRLAAGGSASWYTIERQLKKHLRRAAAYVYYFRR